MINGHALLFMLVKTPADIEKFKEMNVIEGNIDKEY